MADTSTLRCAPVVVGISDAARMLNTSEARVRELVRSGLIDTVPHLSSDSKLAIAVQELERFASLGVTRRRLEVAQ